MIKYYLKSQMCWGDTRSGKRNKAATAAKKVRDARALLLKETENSDTSEIEPR